MALARPADLNDLELTYWTKDPRNPIVFEGKGTCFPSTIWKAGDHWNFLADGERWTTTDLTFHSWTAVDPGGSISGSEGFPTGGNGGEWFLPLPRTVGGKLPPAGSPDHVVSVRSGNQYLSGQYDSEKETFTAKSEGCQVSKNDEFCI